MTARTDPLDLLIVGGGTAGLVAAHTAASLGASVAIVERDRLGGDCLWTGCVPSKSLIAVASAVANTRRAEALGVHVGDVRIDFDEVMGHVRSAIRTIEPVDSAEALAEIGVPVVSGAGRFVEPGVLEVDGRAVNFRQALIATGAGPAPPPIPGLLDVPYLTSDTIWELTELPKDLAIVGAGPIGCELGQAFARLGSRVTLVEEADRVLPREDPEASAIIERALREDGVRVQLGCRVERVDSTAGPGGSDPAASLHLRSQDGTETVSFDRLLVATGRRPRTEGLGLESVAVGVDDRGFIKTDSSLRTTNPRIWAAGDLTSRPQQTHVAGVDASVATSNALLGLSRRIETRAVPRVTYTDPEVAAAGYRTHGSFRGGLTTVTHTHDGVDRAIADGRTNGFSRLVLDKKGRVLGGTVVSPRAGETINEVTTAVQHGLKARDLATTIHPYPTYSDGIWQAAISDTQASLARPPISSALSALGRLRRATLRSP